MYRLYDTIPATRRIIYWSISVLQCPPTNLIEVLPSALPSVLLSALPNVSFVYDTIPATYYMLINFCCAVSSDESNGGATKCPTKRPTKRPTKCIVCIWYHSCHKELYIDQFLFCSVLRRIWWRCYKAPSVLLSALPNVSFVYDTIAAT